MRQRPVADSVSTALSAMPPAAEGAAAGLACVFRGRRVIEADEGVGGAQQEGWAEEEGKAISWWLGCLEEQQLEENRGGPEGEE